MKDLFTVKQMSQLTQLDDGTWGYDFLVLLNKDLDNILMSLKEEYAKKGLNEENRKLLEKAVNETVLKFLNEEITSETVIEKVEEKPKQQAAKPNNKKRKTKKRK